MNQFTPNPRVFVRKFAEIFVCQGETLVANLPPVSTTLAANFATSFASVVQRSPPSSSKHKLAVLSSLFLMFFWLSWVRIRPICLPERWIIRIQEISSDYYISPINLNLVVSPARTEYPLPKPEGGRRCRAHGLCQVTKPVFPVMESIPCRLHVLIGMLSRVKEFFFINAIGVHANIF